MYTVTFCIACSADGEPQCVGPTKKFLSCNIQVSQLALPICKYCMHHFNDR